MVKFDLKFSFGRLFTIKKYTTSSPNCEDENEKMLLIMAFIQEECKQGSNK
jgi:hypothetical protein